MGCVSVRVCVCARACLAGTATLYPNTNLSDMCQMIGLLTIALTALTSTSGY